MRSLQAMSQEVTKLDDFAARPHVHACAHSRMPMRTNVGRYVRLHPHMHACMHACMHALPPTHRHMHVRTHACTPASLHLLARSLTHSLTHARANARRHAHMHAHTHACRRASHACRHAWSNICMHRSWQSWSSLASSVVDLVILGTTTPRRILGLGGISEFNNALPLEFQEERRSKGS